MLKLLIKYQVGKSVEVEIFVSFQIRRRLYLMGVGNVEDPACLVGHEFPALSIHMCLYIGLTITFYSPAQLARGFTPSELLNKPWSQVSSLLPPGTCLHFLSRIRFSILKVLPRFYARRLFHRTYTHRQRNDAMYYKTRGCLQAQAILWQRFLY